MAANTDRHALLMGGSGQIGEAAVARLLAAGWRISALSRQPRQSRPGLQWLAGELDNPGELPHQVDCIFSMGPLDAFARWYAASSIDCPRVIAFGSTSLETKQTSLDAHEGDLALRLHQAEASVFATASQRSAVATLLRPTLVYGSGRDQNISRIAAMARRSGFFILPSGASGLRQPVHVEDLAAAALAVFDCDAAGGKAYALPGAEALPYDQMVARTLRALAPSARLWRLPMPVFRLAVKVARASGRLQGLTDAAISRLGEDLVFDDSAARADFGYAPRGFVL
ncbi:NAD-dependent epimerase/dehydratase family protein [Pseudoxanthomonas dokdonensis]|nr:nucleoside-diphosphate sugar epimerase [Pseudoxanthomonas dokdonensis]